MAKENKRYYVKVSKNGRPSLEAMLQLFVQLTGRMPSDSDLAEARRKIEAFPTRSSRKKKR